MRVVHASWPAPGAETPGGSVLWAEDSSLGPITGRRGRQPRLAPHPYAVDTAELTTIVGVPAVTGADGVELTLPTRGGAPLPSPELVREGDPSSTGQVRPGRWRVPAVRLDVDQTYAWVSGLEPTAIAYGASVHHLVELVAFADDLVTRGRILPTVVSEGPAAVWRPVLTGPDAAWARVLAAALPPALLAAGTRPDRDAPGPTETPPAIRWRCGPPRSTIWSTPRSGPGWDRCDSPSVVGVRRPAGRGWPR